MDDRGPDTQRGSATGGAPDAALPSRAESPAAAYAGRTRYTLLEYEAALANASIGIAVCTFMLARGVQVNHAEMGARITRMSAPFDLDRITAFGGVSEAGMRVVDGMVNKQAAMVGYLNDFYLMGLLCWASIPVLFFVKADKPAAQRAPQMAAAADH